MQGDLAFGEVESLQIDVLSETGWFDDAEFKQTMAAHGGSGASQYCIPWRAENAGGYAALITATLPGGEQKRILLDTGWNNGWMDWVYARSGVDAMLAQGGIDFLVLSHWHLDHFWGIESTLKHAPGLPIIAPGTWRSADRALLREGAALTADDGDGNAVALCSNRVPHEGPLTLTTPDGEDGRGIYTPFPGLAIRLFDVPILLQVQGENVLYFNVHDRGIVTVTGCGHPGIMSLLSFARQNFRENRLYGCYGGLHLSVFDTWKPEFDDIIDEVKAADMRKVGCNHCTGRMWAKKAAAQGVPIVRGTDAYLSYPKQATAAVEGENVFLGNGDSVTF